MPRTRTVNQRSGANNVRAFGTTVISGGQRAHQFAVCLDIDLRLCVRHGIGGG